MAHEKPAALVTGGAKRIGAAFVKALAEDGHRVAIHYNSSADEAEALAGTITAAGGKAIAIHGDLSSSTAVSDLIQSVSAELGPVGVLVNSASVFEADQLATLQPANFDRHMHANLLAPALLSKAFARQGGEAGLIVNMLDYKLFNLNGDYLSYTLSKSGLKTLTEVLARQLAPRIRVNAIAPGLTLPSAHHDEEEFARLHNDNPLKTGVSPDDLVRALRFFKDTPSVSGQTICVDGGQHFDPRLNRDVFDAL